MWSFQRPARVSRRRREGAERSGVPEHRRGKSNIGENSPRDAPVSYMGAVLLSDWRTLWLGSYGVRRFCLVAALTLKLMELQQASTRWQQPKPQQRKSRAGLFSIFE